MKKIISISLFLISTITSFAQVTFQKTFGGAGEDYCYSVQQTIDGGYIITGMSNSFGSGYTDVYLVKTDANGDSLWTRTFGGPDVDKGYCVQQTADGGFIIVGSTVSFSSFYEDIYLIRTDANGDSLWTKTIGGTNTDIGYSVQQTTDGGYIIAGQTLSFNTSSVEPDIYLIKTDSNANLVWTRTFGDGSVGDYGYSVQQTSDGGYIVAGKTRDFSTTYNDVCLFKTNAYGNVDWAKSFGAAPEDYGRSVQQTSDGGYIISGTTTSFGAGTGDVYLIRTDGNGDTLWTKTFGGTAGEGSNDIRQTSDGGFIIAGLTSSFGAGFSDVYLIRTDSNGDTLWTKTFGGIDNEVASSVKQTADGGFIIAGLSMSFGAGLHDFYLIKTDSNGNSACNQGSTATIVSATSTQVTNPPVTVFSGGIVTTPATIVGSGGIVTTLCTTVGLSPTPTLPGGEGVAIAPNPTTNNFTIIFLNTIPKGSIEIYDIMGEKIFESTIFNVSQKEIRLKNMEAGIYFVKVSTDGKVYTEKLIIQ